MSGQVGTALAYTAAWSVVGCLVAARLQRADASRWTFALHAALWPFFAPLLMGEAAAPVAEGQTDSPEHALLEALGALDGVAADVLAPELTRATGVVAATRRARSRLAQMDVQLAHADVAATRAEAMRDGLRATGAARGDPRLRAVEETLVHVERLRALRARTAEELERARLQIEALTAQLRLLRFADAPERDVLDRLREVAAGVDAVAEALGGAAEGGSSEAGAIGSS